MKNWNLVLLIGLLLINIGLARAEYHPLRSDVTDEKPQTTLLHSDVRGVDFEIRIPRVEISQVALQGRRWDRIELNGGGLTGNLGSPELATLSQLIAIPATAGVHAEIEILESTTLPDINLMPAQGKDPEEIALTPGSVQFDMASYSQDTFIGFPAASVGEPALWRGVRLVPIQTCPVSYNPTSHELRIAHRYRVKVRFEGSDLRNVPTQPLRPMSHAWAKLMRSMIANFDELAVDEVPVGSYLIVCVADSNLVTVKLAPLVEWKRRKGHTVVVSTFPPNSTTTTIKNIIQAAYNSWAIPPEYVLLFGDTSGDYTLPAWESYGIDHNYAQLDGTDILADVALGRLPATTLAEADMMVARQILYEKTPYVASTNWFKQAILVSGSYYSGISCVQVGLWIKSRLLEHGFTRIDTLWYTGSGYDPNFVVSGINAGMSYFNYRGYIGMGGFGTGNIDQLTNGQQLIFASIPTCGTGGFATESTMKHFVSVGSVATMKGAIGCVGTATSSTHTRFNNTVNVGIYAGLMDEGITQEGNALNRGKIELYNAYQQNDAGNVINFSTWNALAGDPGCDLYTGPISFLDCNVPELVSLGDNFLSLTVNRSGYGPLAGATVCLYTPNQYQVVGETDALGHVNMPLPTSFTGGIKVTVTYPGCYPVSDSLSIVQTSIMVGYFSHTVDDDNLGGSSGDGDGIINPGEIVELPLVYKNFGVSTTATSVTTGCTESDPFLTLIDSTETFPNIAPGQTANSIDDFDLSIAPDCPNGHTIHLTLATQASQGLWGGGMDLNVASYDMEVLSMYAIGADTLLSPGETTNIIFTVKNNGAKAATSLTGTLTSLDPYVAVLDNNATFGTIGIGGTGSCATNPFMMNASSMTPPGWKAKFRIVYTSSGGATQVDTVSMQIGVKSMTDPAGPDAYGYYCYDDLDAIYPERPIYSWIEISGVGTQLSINDPSENTDQSVNVSLPFTFRYYGQNVNIITICSNGWIATHSDLTFTDFRNYPIPAAMGPSGMIAPFWDDLITSSSGHVFTFNDVANHRFIVEWYNMPNFGGTSVLETFQVILYDATYMPTPTGDGDIVFQYNTIGEVYGMGDDNPYSTIGIERPDQQDGIEVVYWNTYENPAIAHLQNMRAYKFTTSFTYGLPTHTMDVNIMAINPPIVIPANGGSFQYNLNVHNLTTQPQTFSIWNKVRNASNVYTQVFGPISRILPGGANPTRTLTQTIAGSISSGMLFYISYVGTYPNVIQDSSYFVFTKTAAEDGGPWINESFLSGDVFDEYATTIPETPLPTQFALHRAYPNPFNPTTNIRFDLPEAGMVALEVFDIKGCRVGVGLDPTRLDAGNHEITFDGTGLPSGVYLYRLTAGKNVASGKLVLLK
jgi:hypothetical protein